MILAVLHLLSELPDPKSSESQVWLIAVCLGALPSLAALKVLITRNPTLGKEFVTRIEFDAHVKASTDATEGLRLVLKSNNEAGEGRASDLHKRIDVLPERIIRLLRETKGLL